MALRFARIHGRIVPIRDGKRDMRSDYHKAAAIGAGAGALAGASYILKRGSQFGQKSVGGMLAGTALGVAAGGVGIYGLVRSIRQGANQKEGKRARTFFGHYFSQAAGTAVGQAGALGLGAAAAYGIRGIKRAGGIKGIAGRVKSLVHP